MVVPFGVSVGDFIAGIKLFKGEIESFSSTRGARADYIELRKCLGAETSLNAANQFTDLTRSRCPGCHHQDHIDMEENVKVKW
jgi:hypothetical protein